MPCDNIIQQPLGLGAISGLLLGLFVWLDLVLLDIVAFESAAFWVSPVVGLVLGIALALWAPFGRGPTPAPATDPVGTTGAATGGDDLPPPTATTDDTASAPGSAEVAGGGGGDGGA